MQMIQLYTSFKTSCSFDMESAQLRIYNVEACTRSLYSEPVLGACIRDIELWMLINELKMNNGKSDVAFFSHYHITVSAFCFYL